MKSVYLILNNLPLIIVVIMGAFAAFRVVVCDCRQVALRFATLSCRAKVCNVVPGAALRLTTFS